MIYTPVAKQFEKEINEFLPIATSEFIPESMKRLLFENLLHMAMLYGKQVGLDEFAEKMGIKFTGQEKA